jgi:hypothetical protein
MTLDPQLTDPTVLRAQSRAFAHLAMVVRTAAARLDNRVRCTPYQGPGANGFRDRMAAHHQEALRIAARLEDVAAELAGPRVP